MNVSPTLVIGGSGKTGRRIVEGLKARGIPVRIGSRSAAIPFDWDRPETWENAMQGCERIYVAYSPDLAVPQAKPAIERLCQIARHQNVKKIVLLSGRGEPEAQACEQIVMGAGMDWTVLRCSWFNQNFNESFLLDYVRLGTLALPVGDLKEPFVDADDIAEAAVAALTESAHSNRLYELTGPELLTFADLAKILSEETGYKIKFKNVSHESFLESLSKSGVPEPLIQLLDYLFAHILDGRNAHLSDGVQQALGRPPKSFRDFAKEAAATGVWSPIDIAT
ncbi:NAD(P)H-binding protein [Pelagicoccus sp. SDUM812003]|uniref:NAD(P)H-binding protein n=1 Tax=Pelagicoccus sp. SDUM812003 TaxID=3041267 RepID=UPI0028103F3D|nr:NAD(P)H-binding protein [Pelagicoccus sp. SDUM812003]MDQ8201739.1 NAD(P)H-binding protein [Pelagicoccus sp. SDUM812003]